MDDVVSIANRKVQIQFAVNRFSEQTLAMVYQRLLPSIEQNDQLENPLTALRVLATQPQPTAEVTP